VKSIPNFDKGFEQSVFKWQEFLKVERERQRMTMKSFEETKKGQELKKGSAGAASTKTGKKPTEKNDNLNASKGGNNGSNNNSLNNSFGSANSLDSADEGSSERRNSMDDTSTSSVLSETEAARLRLKCKEG